MYVAKSNKNVHLKYFGIPKILPFLKPYPVYLALIVICFAVCSAIDAVLPLFQNYAITHFVGMSTLDTLPYFVGAYMVFLIVQTVVNIGGTYVAAMLEVLVDRDLRQACFHHVQTLSFSYFNRNSVGYIHSRIISDPDTIGILVSWGLMNVVLDVVYIIGIFVVMFALNVYLGFLLLLILPVQYGMLVFFRGRIADAEARVREQNSIITGNFNETVTGMKTVKTLVIENIRQKMFETHTENMYQDSVRAGRARVMFHQSIVVLSSIVLALVLWQGGQLTREGLLLVGSLAVFMNYATSMTVYLRDLVRNISRLIRCQVNIERIDRLLHTQPDVVDRTAVTDIYGDVFDAKEENWEPMEGHVSFRDVSFRYPDGEEQVLDHFSLEVPKGTMVAIVGETGAGKSTVINLLCRFFEPTEGHIFIDGADLRDRSQLWLHRHIGYVLQTPHLFSGSILENLRYGNPDATMEEVEQAVRHVRADSIINRLEDGYAAKIGEEGSDLSTGEKQLLSFARALLVNPEILILDEATSSVDTLTEQHIQHAIEEVSRGRTTFVIAHRLSTIRHADVILAMQNGRIVEQGSHKELMARKGYYHQLYTRQFRLEAEEELLGMKNTNK